VLLASDRGPVGQLVVVGVGVVEKAAFLDQETPRVLGPKRLYQPKGRWPVVRSKDCTARAMCSRSSASLSRNGSIQRHPWQHTSYPASRTATATAGLRSKANAQPNIVTGIERWRNRSNKRHMPTRLPYS